MAQYLGWVIRRTDGAGFFKFVAGDLPQWSPKGRGRIVGSDEAVALLAKLRGLGYEATAVQVGILDGDLALDGEG